jgi:hypothetical protein
MTIAPNDTKESVDIHPGYEGFNPNLDKSGAFIPYLPQPPIITLVEAG